MTSYALDNAMDQTGQRFTSLESCLDPVTIRQLDRIGVAEGWSCLEVGGGGGSIARWLAARAGPDGRVVVTDINPRWLDVPDPAIEVRRHDIVADPLPTDAFDVVHARLVLLHLPERDRALRRMVAALKPGGRLLVEDFDCTWLPPTPVCRAPDAELFLRVHNEFHRILEAHGADVGYGRHYHRRLRDHGLINITVEVHAEIWTGGSPGCRLHRANFEQLHDEIVAGGAIGERDLERVYALLDEPDFSVFSYPLVSAAGQRSATTAAEVPALG